MQFFCPKKASNESVIFITNSSPEERGSSLYYVFTIGTIRCSGSFKDGRVATTFIRPYLINYIDEQSNSISDKAACELVPFEGEAENSLELLELKEKGGGHFGHAISEIITNNDFFNLDFIPKTWLGIDYGGITWEIARKEIWDALAYLTEKNYIVEKTESPVDLESYLDYYNSLLKPQP